MGGVFKVWGNTMLPPSEHSIAASMWLLYPTGVHWSATAIIEESPMLAYPLSRGTLHGIDTETPSPAGHATWFSRAERVPELPKVVNTFTGAYASNLLFFVFPGHVDPNVPLTLGLMIERQMHIIKWLNKAEGACTAFMAGMYSSHCDYLLVGVEFLVIDWYCRVPQEGVGGLSIVACATSRQIHRALFIHTGNLHRSST
jgi:hypothetical protein